MTAVLTWFVGLPLAAQMASMVGAALVVAMVTRPKERGRR